MMTRTRTLGAVACTAVLALSVVGCGSSDDKDNNAADNSTTLTAADFKTQADALCTESNKETATYGSDISETSSDADVTAAIDQTVARYTKLIGDLDALKAPADMTADVSSMLDSLRASVAELDKISSVTDMAALDDTAGPFAEAAAKAKALGLQTCGS